VNNEMQVITSILNLAQLWTRVQPDYKPSRVMKSDLPDALTQEEATRLLTTAAKSCPNAVAPYAAVLAFSTGMRSGEIKGIRSATCTTNRPIRLCMSGGPRVRPTPEQGAWHWTEWRSGVCTSWLHGRGYLGAVPLRTTCSPRIGRDIQDQAILSIKARLVMIPATHKRRGKKSGRNSGARSQ